jgi:ABC-type polar amino acid transport system ATPase subunit
MDNLLNPDAEKYALIEFEKVNKYFGDIHVLKDITLKIWKSETLVVIGPSGGGKSTLGRCLNKLEEIDNGTIYFEGKPLPSTHRIGFLKKFRVQKEIYKLRQDIGMVFQQYNNLFPHMTILQNVIEAPINVKKIHKDEAIENAKNLLKEFGLSDKIDSLPVQLSGGQQQRVAIIRALAMNPKAIVFDEVTSALDPELISDVLETMEIISNKGMTMIVITHEMSFARRCADRFIFMEEGRIAEQGSLEEMENDPKNKRTLAFLSSLDN